MSKIIIRMKNKKIFRINIKSSKKSKKGDFDIMLDAGRSMVFDYAVAGNFFRCFENEVNSISWHGFYEEKESQKVMLPVAHFKKKLGVNERLRHFGSINIEECIPFPVCSVYIPANIDVSGLSNSGVSRNKNFIVDVDEDCCSSNMRYDFFIFPKGFHFEDFQKSVAIIIFETQSIDVFNNGGDLSSPEDDMVFCYHELSDGESVLLRKTIEPKGSYEKLRGTYSVVIHEPNDVYNILNRSVISELEDGTLSQPELMQELHEKEIRGK